MDAIDKINQFLYQKGMSGAELSRLIGVSNSVYSQWNTKTTKPSRKSLLKVAEVLGVDVVNLLPDKKEKPSTVKGEELNYSDMQLLDAIHRADPTALKAIRVLLGIE
jgi:transcriptional regulator with XRE-family HTH domain